MICQYGCGQEAKYKFKNGKWCCSKNVASCPASREKISLKNTGHIKSEEWRKKISDSMKGRPPWNKGKNDYLTDEIRENMGSQNKGREPWNKDKTDIYIEETLLKMRDFAKERKGEKSSNWKGGYAIKNIPVYDKYALDISYAEDCRRDQNDKNILQVKCAYCGKWFTPTISQVYERKRALNGNQGGEQRLYCSNQCKLECPIYNQKKYPKDHKPATSREVQPELRQMRFEIDNYTCQRCKKHQDQLDVGLHCHHIEGIRWEPLESADIDKCITYCKYCHIKVHKQDGCGYNEMRCNKNERPEKN